MSDVPPREPLRLIRDKFWLNDPVQLFTDFQIIPTPGQSLEKRLNTLTKLVIVIFLVAFLFTLSNPEFPVGVSWQVLVFSLLLIIILYYTQASSAQQNASDLPLKSQEAARFLKEDYTPEMQRVNSPPQQRPLYSGSDLKGSPPKPVIQQRTSLREAYTDVVGNSQPKFYENIQHKIPFGVNGRNQGSIWQIKQAPLMMSSTGPIEPPNALNPQGGYRNQTVPYNPDRPGGPFLNRGPPNPKMNRPPVMVPNAQSDVWGMPYHVHSHINDSKVRFLPNDPSDYDAETTKRRIFGDQQRNLTHGPRTSEEPEFSSFRYTQRDERGSRSSDDRPSLSPEEQYGDYYQKQGKIMDQSGMDSGDLIESFEETPNTIVGEDRYYPSDPSGGEGPLSGAPYRADTIRNPGLPSTLSVEDDHRYDYTDNLLTRVSSTDTRRMIQHEVIEDVNSGNMGVSYEPQYYYTNNLLGPTNINQYSHTQLNPQSVRDSADLSPNRGEEMPTRGPWSSKHSPYGAQPGSYRPESIYDPRWTGYGDGNRAYEDVTTGQIRYYHRNLEAFRYGDLFNTLTKNNLDHVDAYTPTGEVWSTPTLTNDFDEDYRQQGLNQFDSDTLSHRQSMMESQMRKQNRREWALRLAPKNPAVAYR